MLLFCIEMKGQRRRRGEFDRFPGVIKIGFGLFESPETLNSDKSKMPARQVAKMVRANRSSLIPNARRIQCRAVSQHRRTSTLDPVLSQSFPISYPPALNTFCVSLRFCNLKRRRYVLTPRPIIVPIIRRKRSFKLLVSLFYR